MKKLNKKLQLNKETIARLTADQQSSVYGGDLPTKGCGSGFDYNYCYATAGLNCTVVPSALPSCPCPIPYETYGCSEDINSPQCNTRAVKCVISGASRCIC